MYVWIILLFFSSLQGSDKIPQILTLVTGDIKSKDIKSGTQEDLLRMKENCKNIAHQLRAPTKISTLKGKSFSLLKIKKWVKSIQSDSIAIFYYSGHGLQSRDKKDLWPELPYFDSKKVQFLKGSQICKYIENRHPRLALIIFDCCNDLLLPKSYSPFPKQASSLFFVPYDTPLPGLRHLFLETKGIITACAASPGEPALTYIGGSQLGSIFSISFIASLVHECRELNPDWSTVFNQTIPPTQEVTSGRQHPIYILNTY